MASFQPSTALRAQKPNPTKNVLSTTSNLTGNTKNGTTGIESHPQLGKWYMRNYGIGPLQSVKQLTTNKTPIENRYTKIKFRTKSGIASISQLNFSNSSSLVVASGPRVSLYGGVNRSTVGTSDFTRALKGGSLIQRRRSTREEEEDDSFSDSDDDGSVDLFGGKVTKKKSQVGGEDGLDDINADRNISTGGLIASCAAHRNDSKLIAIGTEGGSVKICDANSRATLRTFNSSKSSNNSSEGGGGGGRDRKTIRAVSWLRDGKRVVAGGDDGVVRVWNVSGGMKDGGLGSGGAEITLRGHGDKVSSIKVITLRKDDDNDKKKKRKINDVDNDSLPVWSQLVVSGSYDHTIRVWDIESIDERGEDRCVSIMNHEEPIQALLVLPPTKSSRVGLSKVSKKVSKLDNLSLLVSAGGTTLKVWNPLNGSCLGTFQTKHAKTITSLSLLDIPYDESEDDNDQGTNYRHKRHIITAGLDGLFRIHSASNEDIVSGSLPYLHGMQIGSPIAALAISSDMSRFAIGTSTGVVIVHQRRRLITQLKTQDGERKEPRHGTFSYFQRGAHETTQDPDDYLLMHQKKQRLSEYDLLLRKFRYGDALDAVLAKRQPQAVIAVIEELGKRRGLTIALSNRDEESLDSILSFTIRFIDNPQYTTHLIGVAHILCDIYGSLHGQSAVVDELFAKLREKVTNECSVQKSILRLLGQLDYVITAAEIAEQSGGSK